MKKIVEVNSFNEILEYAKKKNLVYVDDGSEGECYLGNDGLAYKIYYKDSFINDHQFIKVEDIVTEEEYELESFAFPKVLFTVDGEVKCYTSKYINALKLDSPT